ncbi:hypothetical protein Tco_1556333 [Tanacetum coccineum]
MSAMLSSDGTFSMEMFPFGHCLEGNDDVSLVCFVCENNNNNNRISFSIAKFRLNTTIFTGYTMNPTSLFEAIQPLGTDISKITRKPSKTGKHGHGKRKSTREAKDSKPKLRKSQASGQISNLKSFYWLTKARVPRWMKKTHKNDGNCTGYTHRSNIKCHIMDCHTSNPCEIESHPTAQDDSQMIEGMIGQDSKERVQQGTA